MLLLQKKYLLGLLLLIVPMMALQMAFVPDEKAVKPAERSRALAQLKTLVAQSSGRPSEAQLLEIEESNKGSRAAALARFLRAYLKYSQQEYLAAAQLFDEESAKTAGIGDYALYYKALSLQQGGQYLEAAQVAQRLDAYADSLHRRAGILLAGECLMQVGDYTGARKLLATLGSDGTALMLVARSFEAEQKTDEAVQSYRKVYYETPASSESTEAAKRLQQMGVVLPEAGQQLQTRATRLYEAGLYATASEALLALQARSPEVFAQDSQNSFRLGVSLHRAGRHAEALKALLAVSFSERAQYIEARYLAALSAQKLGSTARFTELALQTLELKPPADYAADLLSRLVELNSRTAPEVAEKYRNRLIKEYPESKQADDLSYKMAWKLHQEGKYEEASDALLKHMCDIPSTNYRGQVAFWAGRDAEKAGNVSRALAVYEAIPIRYRYGYYGYLAEKRIAELRARKVKAEQPGSGSVLACALATIQPARPLPETATAQAEVRLQRAESLQTIGLGDLAIAELEEARLSAPNSHRINLEIARIHYGRGEYLRAVRVLQRAHPDYLAYQGGEVSEEVFEIFFPLHSWKTIREEARRHGIDPFIVAGLIRQESHFEPNARSRANALGLMQLLPSTGRLVAKKAGQNITAEDLYRPDLNIKLGVSYLAEMLNKYGRIEYAAAAYNGGPGRVSRWRETLPTDIEEWVEAIPISETRGYVQGVLRNSAHYRRIYSERLAEK